MKLTREYIEELSVGEELDHLVSVHVFNRLDIDYGYSRNTSYCKEIIEKYETHILMNYLVPSCGFSYGWHCKIGGIHVRGCVTLEESVCKASLLYSIPELWEESEVYQNKLLDIKMTDDKFNKLKDVIYKLEEDKLYTKEEIKKLFRCNSII